jgi:uncharacterized protein (TIGR03083 family)
VVKPTEIARTIGVEDKARPGHAKSGPGLRIPAGFGLYELQSGCANLTDDNLCSIYSERPMCCRDFEMGSPACLRLRREAGLDTHLPPLEEDVPIELRPLTEQLTESYFPNLKDEAGAPATATNPEPLALSELRMLVNHETSWISARLAQCDANSWSRRTRCAEWNVGALARHLTTTQRFAAEALHAALEGRSAVAPNAFTGDRKATVRAFDRAARDVVHALSQLPPDRVQGKLRIDDEEVVVEHLLQVLAMELAVHACDLADALGEERHLTSDAMKATANALPDLLDPGPAPKQATSYALRSIAFEIPFTWRGSTWCYEPGADPCRIEGDVEGVLLFALGRQSLEESGLSTNRPEVARGFKRHLSGP